MSYSKKWWVIVALLFAFALTVSVLTAQTEEPSAVNAPNSAKVQADSAEVQSSSDEPEQKQPTLEPNRDTASADVETDRRFNELRRELLDDRAKMIEERAKTLDWWLAATAIFLTFLAIIIPIAAFIGGRFSFKKFNEIKEEAQRYVEEIRARRDEAESLVKGINAEVAGDDPDKASEVVENVQQNPDSSPIDRAVAAALSLQQQNRTEEALEKWNSIANVVEGDDNELAARAWFSIGYLAFFGKLDLEMTINAYDKALRLNPDLVEAYYNRGLAKLPLGQWEAAIADFDTTIARKPDYAQAYYSRGFAKGVLGQYEAAIADYDAAIAQRPDYPEAYYSRGMTKEALGQWEPAIADFDAAIAQKPDYNQAYYRRGVAKEALGQSEAAFTDYDEAIRLYPLVA